MDTKEITDKFAFFEGRLQDLEHFQQQDYAFVWAELQRLAQGQRELGGAIASLRGGQRFEEIINKAVKAPKAKTKLSTKVFSIGVGIAVGVVIAEVAVQHKKKQEAANERG